MKDTKIVNQLITKLNCAKNQSVGIFPRKQNQENVREFEVILGVEYERIVDLLLSGHTLAQVIIDEIGARN